MQLVYRYASGAVEVTAATPAAEIPNARAFASVVNAAADDVNANAGGGGGADRRAFSRKNARGLLVGGGGGGGPIAIGRGGASGVAQLCKSLIVSGSCGDPECSKRHATSPEELSEVRRSKLNAVKRAQAAVAREFDPVGLYQSNALDS
jgi:hypothetical protein